MEKYFVSYNTALKLKEKGFDEPCFGWWAFPDDIYFSSDGCPFENKHLNKNFVAPTHQQVIDWFREKHNMHININSQANSLDSSVNTFSPNGKYGGTIDDVTIGREMTASDTIQLIPTGDSYYEALNNAIEEVIKILPNV